MQADVHKNTSDPQLEAIKHILISLEKSLEALSTDISDGHTLLDLGVKNELVSTIEMSLQNPLALMADISDSIDKRVKHIFNLYVKYYFKKYKEVVHSIYLSNNSVNDLYYSIVLTEDNPKNREIVFDFYEDFPLTNFTNKYPIYFQITPLELVDSIYEKEKVNLDA